MSQSCVRVNPQKWVDESSEGEERAILVTVERPRSHDLFCTKNIVFLGPLGLEEGGIPLRTLTVGPGNRDVAAKSDDASGHSFHVNTTTFYAHYACDEGLVAAQFEILWQFQRFTRNERVPGLSNELRDRILTLDGESTPPRTAYDERNHQYVYQGWKRAHFQKFWEEYRMFKNSAHVFWRHMKFVHNEKVDWRKLNPPRPLTKSEKKEFEQETKPKSTLDPSNPSKLDMTLEELVSKNQSPKKSPLRRTRNAGVSKDRTPPPARAAYNGSPRKGGQDNSPTSLMVRLTFSLLTALVFANILTTGIRLRIQYPVPGTPSEAAGRIGFLGGIKTTDVADEEVPSQHVSGTTRRRSLRII